MKYTVVPCAYAVAYRGQDGELVAVTEMADRGAAVREMERLNREHAAQRELHAAQVRQQQAVQQRRTVRQFESCEE